MMETIISKNNCDYRIAVVFNKERDQYVLQFTSLKNNNGAEFGCKSFADAKDRFIKNVRFYHGSLDVAGLPLTEEEFLGITPGLLGPDPFLCKPKATSKEVL